jgi:uncharacterized tellurite resistance protein B-like protein
VGKRRSSSGGGLVGAAIIGVIALALSIPKEIWVVIAAVVVLAIVVWLISKNKKQPATSIAFPIPKNNPEPVRLATRSSQNSYVIDVETPSFERRIPPPPPDELARAKWLRPNEAFELAGLRIEGGMVYVGLNLMAVNGRQEPALVNPNLRVVHDNVDVSQRRMQYWPSYGDIDPVARRAYLQWLATGRRDPRADIGYIFLFFYGLERRALVDLPRGVAQPSELTAIKNEVRELLQVYGQQGSFSFYARNFLDYLSVANASVNQEIGMGPPDEPRGYELPLSFRIGLARLAVAKKPVPASWAIKWAFADPIVVCRTPVQRCREEFEKLFPDHYRKVCGEGLVLPLNKTKLRVTYRPASAGFAGTSPSLDVGDLPDITAVGGPQKKLQVVVDACTNELGKYSRFVGRNPEKKTSAEALLLLPVVAWPSALQSGLEEIALDVKSGEATATWAGVTKKFGSEMPLTRNACVSLASRLEEMGIGIEPDFVGGAKTPSANDAVVLFACPRRNEKMVSSGAYAAAELMIDLGALMASADGDVSESEFGLLRKTIDSWQQLDDHCRSRLAAHLQLQISRPPAISGIKKRLDLLSTEARRTVADIIVAVARTDGSITPEEVKLLEKLYRLLQLDPKLVYSDVHEGSGAEGSRKKPGFALDQDRIARLQKETEQISSLLKEVFAEPESSEPVVSAGDSDDVPSDTLLGLDAEHSSFARLLLSRAQWSRQDLEDAASDMELMLDGALERINGATLDEFELPLTEGEDPVEINKEVLEKVFA